MLCASRYSLRRPCRDLLHHKIAHISGQAVLLLPVFDLWLPECRTWCETGSHVIFSVGYCAECGACQVLWCVDMLLLLDWKAPVPVSVLKNLLVFCLLGTILSSCGENNSAADLTTSLDISPNKDVSKKQYIPARIFDKNWQTPVRLGFNDDGWEDSPYLTRDCKKILFFYHPSKSLANPKEAEKITMYLVNNPQKAIANGMDGKIYISRAPFRTKSIHAISQSKTYPSAQACPYISKSGNLFYTSTRESFIRGKGVPATAYVDGKRLDFGTGEEESNPHFCDARDEMWFDCPGDTNICIMEQAKKNGFKGIVTPALAPINHPDAGVKDSQPFLTDDCKTLYFTSTRGGNDVMAIYKSTRSSSGWSQPKLFVSHPAGVAEISMSSDGRKMAFAQLFWRQNGMPGLDIWYAEKK